MRSKSSLRSGERLPQAKHHFTRFAQVNELVGASEAYPDLGFMARMMALCSLPRTNPGDRIQYKRVNGPYTLYMTAGGGNKLPYGNLAAPDPSLGFDRSGADPKPSVDPGFFAFRVHAQAGNLKQQ